MLTPPLNLPKWLEENSHLLKPPVNNYCIHRGGFTVMGSMTLKVVDEGEFKDITINEGDMFLLPVRYANTVGIVVEQDRPETEDDAMRWYCPNCKEIVHQANFHLTDLGSQIKEAIVDFESDLKNRTCKKCGTVASARPEKKD